MVPSLCWGGSNGGRSKVLWRKVDVGETLAWCVLLRLPCSGYSPLCSASTQWSAQAAQGVLRFTQWAKSGEGWGLKRKEKAFELSRKSSTYALQREETYDDFGGEEEAVIQSLRAAWVATRRRPFFFLRNLEYDYYRFYQVLLRMECREWNMITS